MNRGGGVMVGSRGEGAMVGNSDGAVMLGSCCWGAVAGELLLGSCCWEAVVGELLLESCCGGAAFGEQCPGRTKSNPRRNEVKAQGGLKSKPRGEPADEEDFRLIGSELYTLASSCVRINRF